MLVRGPSVPHVATLEPENEQKLNKSIFELDKLISEKPGGLTNVELILGGNSMTTIWNYRNDERLLSQLDMCTALHLALHWLSRHMRDLSRKPTKDRYIEFEQLLLTLKRACHYSSFALERLEKLSISTQAMWHSAESLNSMLQGYKGAVQNYDEWERLKVTIKSYVDIYTPLKQLLEQRSTNLKDIYRCIAELTIKVIAYQKDYPAGKVRVAVNGITVADLLVKLGESVDSAVEAVAVYEAAVAVDNHNMQCLHGAVADQLNIIRD